MAADPNKELMQSIQGEIEKSLPQLHATVLKSYLVEAEKNKELVASQAADLISLRRELNEIQVKMRDLQRLENMEAALKTQAAELAHQKALDAVVVACEKDKTTMAVGLFTTVFRNIDVRSNKFGMVPIINKDQNGVQWTNQQSVNLTETKTQS